MVNWEVVKGVAYVHFSALEAEGKKHSTKSCLTCSVSEDLTAAEKETIITDIAKQLTKLSGGVTESVKVFRVINQKKDEAYLKSEKDFLFKALREGYLAAQAIKDEEQQNGDKFNDPWYYGNAVLKINWLPESIVNKAFDEAGLKYDKYSFDDVFSCNYCIRGLDELSVSSKTKTRKAKAFVECLERYDYEAYVEYPQWD